MYMNMCVCLVCVCLFVSVVCVFVSGIEQRGNMVLKPAEFMVETVEAGLGEVLVYVEDPERHTEEVTKHTHTQDRKSVV